MATYLITGGAGFIGSHIAEKLVSMGEDVRVLDNLSTGKRENILPFEKKITFIRGDILDSKKLHEAVKGADYICHNAALPSVSRSVEDPVSTNENNIKGTLNVLMAAKECGVKRFVLASSSSVYGEKEVLPKSEDQFPEPRSPYAVSKLTGEYYCQNFWINYGLQTISLRYFNVFGERQDPNSHYAAVIPSFISSFLQGRKPTIYGDGNQTRDFTYVANVVVANIRACREDIREFGVPINVCTGERTSVNELFSVIKEMTGADVEPVYGPPRPGDVRDSQGDTKRIRSILKIDKMIYFKDGLKKAIDWYRNNL